MIKLNKQFVLSDNSVNCYGYRLLTDGLDMSKFVPPIGFLMHDREKGVAVRWEDLHIEGDQLIGTPVINDDLFPTLAREIENGFYQAASVGHIVALEWSDDPAQKLPGQTDVTVTKWYPRECSIVDIPGNPNALARLYDENDNVLHDLSNNLITKPMAKTLISPTDLHLQNLSAEATVDQVNAAIDDLQQRADLANTLQTELDNLRAEQTRREVSDMLDKAVAEHRINRPTADMLATQYAGKKDELKALLDTFTPKASVAQTIANAQGAQQKTKAELAAEWDTLDKQNKLAELKKDDPEKFKTLFEARFK